MTSLGTKSLVMQGLLDRLHQGDPLATNELIEFAYDRLVIVTRKMLGSFGGGARVEEETAGVVNEAYNRLKTAIEEVRPPTVKAFMGLAAKKIREVLLDRVRQIDGRGKEPRPKAVPLAGNDSTVTLGVPQLADTDAGGSRNQLALDLLDAIGKLPDEEREVVELIFFHGYSQPEVGEIIGVHEDTVKRRWARARVKLADHLQAFA